jgi:hypothetical protein
VIKEAVNAPTAEVMMFVPEIVPFDMLPEGIKPAIGRVNLNIWLDCVLNWA